MSALGARRPTLAGLFTILFIVRFASLAAAERQSAVLDLSVYDRLLTVGGHHA